MSTFSNVRFYHRKTFLQSKKIFSQTSSKTILKGKLHSKIRSSDLRDLFYVESDGEGPRSKYEWENGQTDRQKMARVRVCHFSGATLPSCTVTRAIRNVHDQLESLRGRPAVVNLLHPVELRPFRSLEFLPPGLAPVTCNTGCVFVT